MSDRIAVMSEGRIEQVDSPDRLYDAPALGLRRDLRRREQRAARQASARPANGMLAGRDAARPGARGQPARARAPAPRPWCSCARSGCSSARSGEVDNRLEGRVVRRELEGPFAHLAIATRGRARPSWSTRPIAATSATPRSATGDLRLRGARRAGAAGGRAGRRTDVAMQGLVQIYGRTLTAIFCLLAAFWVLGLIVVPQLFMVERRCGGRSAAPTRSSSPRGSTSSTTTSRCGRWISPAPTRRSRPSCRRRIAEAEAEIAGSSTRRARRPSGTGCTTTPDERPALPDLRQDHRLCGCWSRCSR